MSLSGLSGCNGATAPGLESGGSGAVTVVPEKSPVERSLRALPPLSGGTLLISKDGKTAFASDPDRDLVWTVDLKTSRVTGWVSMDVGDQPGRLVQDTAGKVHVVLRGAGAVATVKLEADGPKLVERRSVCEDPRGIGYRASSDSLFVACSTGELASLSAAGGAMTQRQFIEADLRDVIVRGEQIAVSRFRSSELITLDSARKVVGRQVPAVASQFTGQPFAPEVAYRVAPLPNGSTVMVHQRAFASTIFVPPTGQGPNQPPAYGGMGGPCAGATLVQSAVTVMTPTGSRSALLTSGALPLDIAVHPSGDQVAAVTGSPGAVSVFYTANVFEGATQQDCSSIETIVVNTGSPIAAAYSPEGGLFVQTRAPAGIVNVETGKSIAFPVPARADVGHALFHKQTATALACASCHPEGHEDGRVWQFSPMGPRRTQALGGKLSETLPLHWDGTLATLDALMSDVFVGRMGGTAPSSAQVAGLQTWLDTLPVPKNKPITDAAAVARGQTLFKDTNVGCATCHSGSKFTNNNTVDVGTGLALQTPSLVGVSSRGPFMHNGCAKTLTDRFGACGGGDKHGVTSNLSAAQIGDLVAYLETL